MIPSKWRRQIMMGYYLTFSEFYIRLLTSPENIVDLNYSIVWERVAKVFGRDSLRIVPLSIR
jgi:hypothetical protein